MTIKPIINQKVSKDDQHQENQVQNINNSCGRTNRSLQLSTSENQPLREKRTLNYEESTTRRRSPHKSNTSRVKKRETRERDKINVTANYNKTQTSCSSPIGNKSPKPKSTTNIINNNNINVANNNNGNNIINSNANTSVTDVIDGYNSGDEHTGNRDSILTPEEWNKRDETFIKTLSERGFIIKEMIEDGACLFRAISLQIYGDQEMHEEIRQQTMDYIFKNREYYAQFVTEDINSYVNRKRASHVHGNHIEIQAMSEMYNRSVELYCYQTEPINIFNSEQLTNGYEPFRLSYQRSSHYNAILDPYKASVGVGLGLAGYMPDELDRKQLHDAVRLSEDLEIEQTMFEDKLKTTDWEATNEAIEEQIARESYLQWCRENMNNNNQKNKTSTSTVTSTDMGNCSSSSSSPEKSPKIMHDETTQKRVPVSATTSISSNNAQSNSSSSKMDTLLKLDENTDKSSSIYSMQYLSQQQHQINRRKKRSISNEMRRIEESPSAAPIESEVASLSPKRLKVFSRGSSKEIETNSPSTSGFNKIETKEQPLSEFYQSLLESSYAIDGQMSEGEMVQKALAVSAMDFLKNVNQHKSNSDDKNCTTDEEYDSPSP